MPKGIRLKPEQIVAHFALQFNRYLFSHEISEPCSITLVRQGGGTSKPRKFKFCRSLVQAKAEEPRLKLVNNGSVSHQIGLMVVIDSCTAKLSTLCDVVAPPAMQRTSVVPNH